MTKKKKPKKGKPVRYLVALVLALGLAGCGITGPKMEPGPTDAMCACFTDPTGNWRCTDPFVQAPQGVQRLAELVAAWAPVIAAGSGHPEITAILQHVKVVACTPEVVV